MSNLVDLNPYGVYNDLQGRPLNNGKVYIGLPNQDPKCYPAQVYWDAAMTIPAAQPLRTVGGYVARNGSPAKVYINGNYSLQVTTSTDVQVFYVQDYYLVGSQQVVTERQLTPVFDSISSLRANTNSNIISKSCSVTSYYGGNAIALQQPPFQGNYFIKTSDTTSADNGGTIIVDVIGNRWYLSDTKVLNPMKFGAKGDLVTDDTIPIKNAFSALTARGNLFFTACAGYKITDTIQIFNKPGAIIDFNNQQINTTGFASARPGLWFKGMSEAIFGNIFMIAGVTTNIGVFVDADAENITIHAKIGKIHVSGGDVAIQIGTETYQVSDCEVEDLYGSDAVTGVLLKGENTLAMNYGRVAAYNNSARGVHIESGGGSIASLQSAASVNDIFFGRTSGLNHSKLARWDITSGYSEEGINNEIFISSVSCSDTNPFQEQIVIHGFRCTPFTSTNVQDFIKWNLNGDLIFKNSTFVHGQQLPQVKVDASGAYRSARVLIEESIITCAPLSLPQVALNYNVTTPKYQVEISARVNNGLSFWQNAGASDAGTIPYGIDTKKSKFFEQALLKTGSLIGAWNLKSITSGQCTNLVLGNASLNQSATIERRDIWMDDGLVGFYRNSTSAKTISTESSVYAAAASTFGCIVRSPIASIDGVDDANLGGSSAIRVGLNVSGGAFAAVRVGAVNIVAAISNPYDPHMVIGRWDPAVSISVNAINLRTGEMVKTTYAGGPAIGDFTWSNGVSISNTQMIRGFPFVYNRALTDIETIGLLQSALQLTDSWRN